MIKHDAYHTFCVRRAAMHQFRYLHETEILPGGHVRCDGQELINFSGNDYLGLSRHPMLIAKVQEYAARYGVGSAASRLVTGNHPAHAALEERLARGKGCEAALVMSSGYQANVTVLAALADVEIIGKPVIVLADRLCHNSLLQGVALSGARLIRFQHNDLDHLANLLRRQRKKDAHIIIVSESVFGMDGDRADLAALISLAQQHEAMLYIDEAHATGLFGPDGFGFATAYKGEIDVVMGTFGKALGSFGAYVACSAAIRDYLIQRCGGLIFSTALPPPTLGAIEAALHLLPQMQKERDYLQVQAEKLRQELQHQGWNIGASTTQIIPVILGGEQAATALAELLKKHGILAPAMRPPTVPRGTSRLRLSLSAAHKVDDIARLITIMAEQAARFHTASESLAS